ncbi:MAG: lysophospholipid acyltransferase family protein [Thermodesulfovibrionales bacterium]
MRNLSYCFFRSFFWIVFKLLFRLEVRDADKVPVHGGVIVASNHASYLDPLILGVALRRRATYMAREGLFRIPIIGAFVRSFSFPVKRGRPQPSTIKEAIRRLRDGELVVMFPEGGRSANGSILDAKRGVGMVAAVSGVRVVPALIEGTDRALPVGARFIRPVKVRVTFGDVMEIKAGETGRGFQERIARDIMEAVRNLKGCKWYGNNSCKEGRILFRCEEGHRYSLRYS